jgi:hypothetical protein
MSLRRFVRALLRGGGRRRRPAHSGDDLAEEIRETIGPVSGGDAGTGRMSGGGVYRHLEDRERL